MSRLFTPLTMGPMPLSHRIAMTPMSRYRADHAHVPTPAMVTYHYQRACVPGTRIIAEASSISRNEIGEAQMTGWRNKIDTGHARGSYIVWQLLAPGRAIDPRLEDIERTIGEFATAARGLTGLKSTGCMGNRSTSSCMDGCNQREDEHGGSIEGRARFCGGGWG
ncbi:hypothetical protein BJX64DRAFT_278709 [Aspergillus heterothallicus]